MSNTVGGGGPVSPQIDSNFLSSYLNFPSFGSGEYFSTNNNNIPLDGNKMVNISTGMQGEEFLGAAAGISLLSKPGYGAAEQMLVEGAKGHQKMMMRHEQEMMGGKKRKRGKGGSGSIDEGITNTNHHQYSDHHHEGMEKPKEVIHVRAKRGQATDSHSLAERVRRERINEKLRVLQDLVPGCYKTMGMAVMLDVIINYVQSLQNQIEFLSMKLSAASLFYDFNSPEAEAVEALQLRTNNCEAREMERIHQQAASEQHHHHQGHGHGHGGGGLFSTTTTPTDGDHLHSMWRF